jgi:hypothetical protein
VPKGEDPISLKDWNEQTLRTLCFKKIFPEVVDKWNSNASLGSFFSPRTTESGSSVDETPQTKPLVELTTPHL